MSSSFIDVKRINLFSAHIDVNTCEDTGSIKSNQNCDKTESIYWAHSLMPLLLLCRLNLFGALIGATIATMQFNLFDVLIGAIAASI